MAGSKMCFKCEQIKPISRFYKHPAMGDGRLGKCKECTKSDTKINRRLNINYYREYDNKRAKEKHRRVLRKKISKRRIKEFPKYGAAHNAVSRAVMKGVLKVGKCQFCGTDKFIHAHHDDYNHPLNVMWLCPVHHSARHAFLNYKP